MVEVESRSAGGDNSHFGWRALLSAFGSHRITYLMGSAMTAAVHCALLGLGLLVAGDSVPYLFLVVVSHCVTVAIVYPWYRLVVFRVSGDSWLRGYARFYAVGLSFLGTSAAGIPILVEFAGIPIMMAQVVVIVLSPPLSYLVHRTWTFRHGGRL
ncbi:GtrA family protein [Streptosporangium canum]|uniref:GtrA family protein n=1 Tax=Streptosporangium canum TaxID=324952 RepID=UPI0034136BB9